MEQNFSMKATLKLQNLKCESCGNTIERKLITLTGIENLSINVESGTIAFNYKSHNTFEGVRDALETLGYPIEGDRNTIISKARSFISCAGGKIVIL